jgi:predicted ATPase
VARGLFPTFQGDVRFVELASLSHPDLVPTAMAGILDLKLGGYEICAESVARAIGAQRLLLVLDNCEHVIDAAARLAETIVRICPRTTILATSREILNIEGEHVYLVPALDVPRQDEETGNILAHSAVQLFIATTRALHSDFSPNRENLPAIAGICRRLDGIPLAIDLAATRVATLGLQQVAAGLDDRLGMLIGGHRTALPRHQTLRATLDWSYQLLPEPERLVMQRLSVFVGDFTAEAASLITAGGGIAASEVVNSLANLVTKSLVMVEVGSGTTHYRLHETTRAYALEKLAETGERDQVARRHANYYRDLFDRAEIEVETLCAPAWLVRYGRQIGQVRAALDWAYSDRGDLTLAVDLTAAAAPVWIHHLLIDECRERIEQAIALFDEKVCRDARRDLQLFSSLAIAHVQSTGDASKIEAASSRADKFAEELNDSEYRIRSLWGLWLGSYFKGDYQGALQIATRFATLPDGAVEAADRFVGERILGVTLHVLGDQARARLHIENMLRGYVAPPGQIHILRYHFDQNVAALTFYAQVLWLQGFPDQAMAVGNRALEDAMTLGQDASLLYALVFGVCPLTLERGDFGVTEGLISRMLSEAFRPMRVWGQCYAGVLGIRRDDTASGQSLLRDGLKGFSKPSFQSRYVFFLGNLAMGAFNAGDHRGALVTIDEALDQSERNDDRWYVAELLRIKGELILREGAPQAAMAAERYFLESLDWARRQGALSWELRTSTSLARLRNDQGRTAEARSLLQSVYDRFREGFETADLKTAKALLKSLHQHTTMLDVRHPKVGT